VSDRGTGQMVGVVTDVGLFLDLLARKIAPHVHSTTPLSAAQ